MVEPDASEREDLLGSPWPFGSRPRCDHCSQPTSCNPYLYGRQPQRRISLIAVCLSTSLVSAIAASFVTAQASRSHSKCSDPSLQLYSPANDFVEYKTLKFNRSRGADKTPFQGMPSDDVDRAWLDLYSPGMLSTTDAHSASQLPEETERFPFPGREDEFVVTLDVFHQIHCLDVVRMALYPDHYDKSFYFPNGTIDYCKWLHVDHCIDQVRQALICNADVSAVHYAWSETLEGLRPRVDNLHTCKDYAKMLEWASANGVAPKTWHPSRHVVIDEDGEFQIEQGKNHDVDGEGECNAI